MPEEIKLSEKARTLVVGGGINIIVVKDMILSVLRTTVRTYPNWLFIGQNTEKI